MAAPDLEDALVLTIDVDWAPDAVLAPLLQRLGDEGVRATVFATHPSPALDKAKGDRIEVGLHPNFSPRWPDAAGPLRELLTHYPEAVGVRAHALVTSSRILQECVAQGLRYEANQFLLYHPNLRPTPRLPGLMSVPGFWSDDNPLCGGPPFRLARLRPDAPGLKVYNFHPIHVFMNTSGPDHYASFHADYQDPDALRGRRNTGPGIGTVFDSLIDHIVEHSLPTWTARDVVASWQSRLAETDLPDPEVFA